MGKTYRYLNEGELVQSYDQRRADDGSWFDTVVQGTVITKFYADRQYYRREVVELPQEEPTSYRPLYIFLSPTDIIQKGDEALTITNPTKPYVSHLFNETQWTPCPEFLYGYTQRYSGDIVRRKVDCSVPAMA
jgi:hypothetical protein